MKGHVPDYLQALQAKDQMQNAMQKDSKQQLELRNYQNLLKIVEKKYILPKKSLLNVQVLL